MRSFTINPRQLTWAFADITTTHSLTRSQLLVHPLSPLPPTPPGPSCQIMIIFLRKSAKKKKKLVQFVVCGILFCFCFFKAGWLLNTGHDEKPVNPAGESTAVHIPADSVRFLFFVCCLFCLFCLFLASSTRLLRNLFFSLFSSPRHYSESSFISCSCPIQLCCGPPATPSYPVH